MAKKNVKASSKRVSRPGSPAKPVPAPTQVGRSLTGGVGQFVTINDKGQITYYNLDNNTVGYAQLPAPASGKIVGPVNVASGGGEVCIAMDAVGNVWRGHVSPGAGREYVFRVRISLDKPPAAP